MTDWMSTNLCCRLFSRQWLFILGYSNKISHDEDEDKNNMCSIIALSENSKTEENFVNA